MQKVFLCHDVIMSAMASQTPVSSLFAQLLVQAQTKEIIKAPQHWPFFSQKRPVTRKMFPFDDVIMCRALTCAAVPIFTNLMTFRTITCKSSRDVNTLSSTTQARVSGTLVDVWNDQMGHLNTIYSLTTWLLTSGVFLALTHRYDVAL